MSFIDFNLLGRSAPLSLQPGMLAGAAREVAQNDASMGDHSAARRDAESQSNLPQQGDLQPRELQRQDAPLSEVAQLHNEAERSMCTGLPSTGRTTTGPSAASDVAKPQPVAAKPGANMHRVREVRREQGVSIKRASQHLGVTVDEARRQEEPTTDLTLSQLFAWQKVCEVPVADLLVEPDCDLSAPVLQRARMVRVMKTVQAIMERTGQVSVQRLGQTLVNQLIELMPELKGVSSWHAVDRRQSCNQNARFLESNYLRPAEEETQGQ